jgi:ariadne-1
MSLLSLRREEAMSVDVESPIRLTSRSKCQWETLITGRKRSKKSAAVEDSGSIPSPSSSESSRSKKEKIKESSKKKNRSSEEKDKKTKAKKAKKCKEKRNSASRCEQEVSTPIDHPIDRFFEGQSKDKEEEEFDSPLYSHSNSDVDYVSEGDDFVGDFDFHEVHPEKPFVCLKEEDIVSEQNKEIEKIAEMLVVTNAQAAGLLRYYKWNKDKLLTAFLDDPDKTLELAGVKVKTSTNNPLDIKIELAENRCSICDIECPESELFAMECKHQFCEICWNQYLTMKIQEGQSGEIPCPSYDCGFLVHQDFVRQIVSEDMFEKYKSFLAKSFVDGNYQVRWCPAPGCGNAVNTDAPVGQTVRCSCGHSFCFRCGEEPHGPAYCEHVREWNKKAQDESETNNWINANTQACPKCNTYTEKNGGCNHMTCRNCSHEYCWMCKKDWRGHSDFYSCNRFEKKSKKVKKAASGKKKSKVDKEMQAQLEKEEHRARLERYLHYYNQFIEFDRHMICASKLKEGALAKIQEWREHDGTSAEALFVEKAFNVLVDCNRALKWSCVRLYYFDDKNVRKNLFEFVKTDLEKATKELTEALKESPYEKAEILNLTRVCETRMLNLLSWHNTCR